MCDKVKRPVKVKWIYPAWISLLIVYFHDNGVLWFDIKFADKEILGPYQQGQKGY